MFVYCSGVPSCQMNIGFVMLCFTGFVIIFFFLCLLQMVDIQYILNWFCLQKKPQQKPLIHCLSWFLAFALQVIPPGQPSWTDESYQGCFTCRVWQFGHWVEVTIDDRLPCFGGKLCFSQCQTEDLFWLPLLEKAYAKYVNIAVDGNRSTILVYFFCLLYLDALGIDLGVVAPGGPILACAEVALWTVDL